MEVRARHGAGISEKAPLHGSLATVAKGRESGMKGQGKNYIRGELCKFCSRFAATLPQESHGIPGGTRCLHGRRR